MAMIPLWISSMKLLIISYLIGQRIGIYSGSTQYGMFLASQFFKINNRGMYALIEKGRVKGRMKKQNGFTLIEALIVIIIIAIVTAIAVPQFQKMGINGNLKAAARDIMGDFSYVRERAISENQNYSILFDKANNNYTFPGLANPKSPASIAPDIRIAGTNFGTTLTFQTRGTVSPSANNTITLTNSRGSTATITIGIAGRIYVQYALL